MNKIYLPTLNTIHIKDFSLYPKGLNYRYKFVKGINLILGGNGLGKTTFVNIIKYGLIGLYKKDLGFIRTYRDKSIKTRKQLPSDYFRNRMDTGYEKNEQAKVVLNFTINNTSFEVTRSLYDAILEKVIISEKEGKKELHGKLISQNNYERLEEEEKKKCLQHNYEMLVAKKANVFSFDDIIFFVNEILTFGENHKTILWDEEEENIQDRISSKYFNDPVLDFKRDESIRESQYFDSLARHKSEDIKTLNKVIARIEASNQTDKNFQKTLHRLDELKRTIERQIETQKEINEERKTTLDKRSLLNTQRNKLSKQIESLERDLNESISKLNDERWFSINPKYGVYLENAKINSVCPMCNQDLSSDEKVFEHAETKCFVCKKTITEYSNSSVAGARINELKEMLKKEFQKRQGLEQETIDIDKKINQLDERYNANDKNLWELEKEKREVDYTLGDKQGEESFELKTLKKQIEELDKEKQKLQEKSKKEKEKAESINQKMEVANTVIAKELSLLFSGYSQKFLGIKSELTYEEIGSANNKRFFPVIDDRLRTSSESLSESQRFFVDHSYRMSLLTLFYEQPTFYICETPDSSLDISYEINAAEVFLEYIKNPNSLIITANLNYSEFLDHIVDKATNMGCVNLFEIGKKSHIQNSNKELAKVLSKIMDKINEKHR